MVLAVFTAVIVGIFGGLYALIHGWRWLKTPRLTTYTPKSDLSRHEQQLRERTKAKRLFNAEQTRLDTEARLRAKAELQASGDEDAAEWV